MKSFLNRIPAPQLTSYRVPFFVLLFLCFAGAILGDSTVEALLLAHYGAEVIPRMYLVNALFLFILSAFSMTLIDRVDRGVFFSTFVLVHSVLVFLVWIAVLFKATFLFIPLFSYGYITKILLFLLFWTLVNDLIDSRHAGKDFPFIAAGGTLGAIIISFSIPWLLRVISPESLLPVWSLISVLLAIGFIPMQRSFGKHFRTTSDKQKRSVRDLKSFIEDLKLVKKEPLLWNMSILYFLLFFILLNQHYEFYTAIKQRFNDARDLAGFLGYFNGLSMGVTFLLQISLAGLVLKKIGSTRSMFLLPASLCLVFGTLTVVGFLFPATSASGIPTLLFWGIVLGVGIRIAFFDSFFSPNFQVFFSSLPQEIRGRGKLSIEGVIKPVAIAFSSFWLLFVAQRVPTGVNMALLFTLAILMIVQTFRIRRKYTESLTRYLTGFDSDSVPDFLSSVKLSKCDNIFTALADILEKEPFEIKRYIVELLADMNSDESIEIIKDYLPRADAPMRSSIVTCFGKLSREDLKPLLMSLVNDEDERVVADTISSLARYNDPEVNEGLAVFLRYPNNRVKANTVIALWPVSATNRRRELLGVLKEMLYSNDDFTRASALYALGEIGERDIVLEELEVFCHTSRDHIDSGGGTWRQLKTALAKTGAKQAIELLLTFAPQTVGKRRKELSAAIAQCLRFGYPVKNLVSLISESDSGCRNLLLEALGAFAAETDENGVFSIEGTLVQVAQEERKALYADYMSFGVLSKRADSNATQLLMSAIMEERIDVHLDSLIHIAALLDRSGQLRRVRGRLHHENRHVRGRALEVLDNVGNTRINRWILDILDTTDVQTRVREGQIRYQLKEKSREDVIASCLESENRWIRQCAEFAAARSN